ncbi:histidine kinase dimerization/phosphoacceptor domain -containing protein [Phenylobacterium sp.]|uniref:histidine kinase dimerization/phosphoacceptor domain -containing protein n=1 Tax=Phenylobacterium sp. TaxID=1871053 RepID=UPI0025D6B2E8|nr:histidine kinase dimerization/phosphoacceptor domain -containing protein [Phenylobacterium sp.]MBX3483816.1 GAF domain-containing protein [Phenylobacterium sp.]
MTDLTAVDLDACAREPIRIPGSIQPHGAMLVADRTTQEIRHAAGDVARLLRRGAWIGRTLGEVLGDPLAERVAQATSSGVGGGYAGRLSAGREAFDVSAGVDGEWLIVEIEPALATPLPAVLLLAQLEAAAAAFERAPNVKALLDRAAVEFRRLTGFDRVMIYRFLDDDAGAVLAEDLADGMPGFMNHHFPGSDIPAQARALYVRNLVRVIPDVRYTPAPLLPAWTGAQPLDMSDCALRSVSPVHMQYLRNMGVGASASMSVVKDGVLWGLIACHHRTPRLMPYDIRAAARTLAGGLARQIRAKEDAEAYRERLRLRGLEDELTSRFARAGGVDANVAAGVGELRRMLDADGVAAIRGGQLHQDGACPPAGEIRKLAEWVQRRSADPVATDRLSEHYAAAKRFTAEASGLLGLVVAADEPFLILWFRAEEPQVVNWAGNPHKAVSLAPGEMLTPRASFEAWREAVRGRSRRWTLAEIDAAARLRETLLEARAHRRQIEMNARLTDAVAEKDGLLQQKEILLKEVNHRIQNSLQLVSSFLGLQSRAMGDPKLHEAFEEARRRLQAVALVHRRLYRADQIEVVDMGRYLEDLIGDMNSSMGAEWAGKVSVDAAPVLTPTDRAVSLGLVVTELVINANKYAYGGAPGPIEVGLDEHNDRLRVVVADHGRGKHAPGEGFGSRMMSAMVRQLGGELAFADNHPGLRAILTCPVSIPMRPTE